MLRYLTPVSLAILLASPAIAQNINIQAGPGGFSMNANVPGEPGMDPGMRMGMGMGTVTTTSTSTVESSEDGYRLGYETSPDGSTLMRVLSPEGAQVQVWDGPKMIAEDDVPMSFKAKGEKYYRIVLKLQNGMIWEKKLPAKRGQHASLWVAPPELNAQVAIQVGAPMPPPQQVVVHQPAPQVVVHEVHHVHQAPPPEPVAVGPMPMSPPDFNALVNAIRGEDFSKEQLTVLQSAAASAFFTINQVGQIVDLFDFGNDKVEAVRTVRGRIVDPQNSFQLYSHFTFSSEKDEVKKILAQ